MESNKNNMKKSYSRSRGYPRYTLTQAIDFIRLIDRLGGQNVLQKTVMAEMDKKNPNDPVLTGKVSSAKQFGLLESSRQGYSLTERAKLILYPTPDVNENQIKMESFMSPSLYSDLISRFKNKELPAKTSLGNILFNQFGISKNAKNRAANVFIKSAEFAGALEEGILKTVDKDDPTQDTIGHKDPDVFKGEDSSVDILLNFEVPVPGGFIKITSTTIPTDEQISDIATALKVMAKISKENK